ncbi:MAG: hypothetical protein PHT40_00635 [Patescibacteria group bacterium]|nr:hypothetical protein [Patescibacteria group bacterium]
MKECSFCGMPLKSDAEADLCDFCLNDDGKEMLAAPAAEELDLENPTSTGWTETVE